MNETRLKPFGGIVPIFAPVFFLLLAGAIVATVLAPDLFRFPGVPPAARIVPGVLLAAAMIPFYLNTVRVFLTDFKEGKVVTRGTYSYCRNPIYATWLIFLLPAAALLVNSWLFLVLDLVLYGVFKLLIPREYAECREAFGAEFIEYERSVSELLPMPWKRYRKER
jgi:protein-S-isoprenylcysteine O-methyltransferase Ste14